MLQLFIINTADIVSSTENVIILTKQAWFYHTGSNVLRQYPRCFIKHSLN